MIRWFCGDSRAVLADLPAASVHVVCTSPPYYGLRDYGVSPVGWADGWNGCLGLEPNPEQFVEHLCEVFDAVARVLRKDGTLWLNLGDSYAGGGRAGRNPEYMGKHTQFGKTSTKGAELYGIPIGVPEGTKAKDMVGIPWMVAFALRKRGWYLRAACPWIKRNSMPSSVKDRPATATENIFLFGHPESGGRYYYDVTAVQIASTGQRGSSANFKRKTKEATVPNQLRTQHRDDRKPTEDTGYRNFRDTDPFFTSLRTILGGGEGMLQDEDGDPLAFVVNPKPFKGSHFAVWPKELVEPMILASTSEKGCCVACGAPWRRVVTKRTPEADWREEDTPRTHRGGNSVRSDGVAGNVGRFSCTEGTADWQPTCTCDVAETTPAVILDPFSGSGTTQLVADQLGRDTIYMDAKSEYWEMAYQRIMGDKG